MLELDKLVFAVETKELDEAIAKVDKLGSAVSKLNKPLKNLEEKSQEASEGVKDLAKESENTEKKLTGVERALEKQATRMKILRDESIQLTDGVERLGKGFTSSQASQLANLKLLGATTEQINLLAKSFKDYNDITGVNTFDASANGLSRLQKEIKELNQVNELASKGFGLTREELKFLARDTNAVTQAFTAEGKSTEELSLALTKLNTEFVQASQSRNKLIAEAKLHEDRLKAEAKAMAESARMQSDSSDAMFRNHQLKMDQDRKTHEQIMKEMRLFYKEQEKLSASTAKPMVAQDSHIAAYYKQQEKATKEAAKATEWLTMEMMRVENALEGLNKNIAVSSSNRLLRFKESLAASGIASDIAAQKYEAYSKVIETIDKKRLAKQKSDEQERIKNLSRGLAPQISDVAVSLYGGMSPMTVLMQQGLQVRDLIQSSGVEAAKLNEVLKKTGSDFLSTLTGTFKAIGSLAVGVLQAAGKSMVDFAMQITFSNALVNRLEDSLIKLGVSAETAAKSFIVMRTVMTTLAAGTLGLGAIILGPTLIAMKQLADEQTSVARSNAEFGASFGASTEEIIKYKSGLNDLGITSATATEIFTEVAKAGNITKEMFDAVAVSASNYSKYVGGEASAVVKQYSQAIKDPVKELTEFGIKTGYVSAEQIKLVDSLVKTGQTNTAQTETVKILEKAYTNMAENAKRDISGLDSTLITLKTTLSTVWDEFKNSSSVANSLDGLNTIVKAISKSVAFLAMGFKQVATMIGFLNSPEGVPIATAWETAKAQMQEYVSEFEKTVKKIDGVGGNGVDGLTPEQRKQNSEKLRTLEAQKKLQEALGLNAKDQSKELTRSQYISLRIEEERIKAGTGAVVSIKLATEAAKKFGEEWDKANKKKQNPIDTSYNNTLEQFSKNIVDATSKQNDYTKSQEAFLNIANSKEWLTYSQAQRNNIAAKAEAAIQTELQAKEEQRLMEIIDQQWKLTSKAQESMKDMQDKRKAEGEKVIQQAKDRIELLNEEFYDLNEQKAIYGKLTSDQKKQLEIAKATLLYKKEIQKIDSNKLLTSENAAEARELAEIERIKRLQNIEQAAILEAVQFEKKQREELVNAFESSIVTALTKGGKEGATQLRNELVSQLSKPITIMVKAVVDQISGLGSSLESDSLIGGASSLITGLGTGLTSITQAGVGGWLSAGSSLIGTGTFSGIGAGLGMLAGPLALVAGIADLISSLDDSGTAHMGGYAAYSAETGTTMGAALRGQAGGQFGLGDADIKTATNTMLAGVSKGIVGILDNTANAFGKQAGYYAATAFADDTSDDGAWGALAIKLGDKVIADWADTQTSRWAPKEFANGEEGLKQYQDALAKSTLDTIKAMGLPEWASNMLSAIGDAPTMESLTTTLSNISAIKAMLTGVGDVIADLFGNTVSSSEEAVIALSGLSGGIEKLTSNLSGYYQNFYTSEERLTKLRNSTTAELAKLGLTLPATREQFRLMLENAQKLGDSKTVAGLLGMQEAINQLVPTFEDVAQAIKDQLSSVEKVIDSLNSVFSLLDTNINSLYAASISKETTAAKGNAFINSAIAIARTGGAIPSEQELSKAIEAARTGVDSNTKFSSLVDQQRAQRELVARLKELQGLTSERISAAEATRIATQDTAKNTAELVSLIEQFVQRNASVQKFASGGVFTNTVVSKPTMFSNSLMGESGPEAIMPLTNIGGTLGVKAVPSDSGVTEALIEQVTLLRAEVRAVVSNTSKVARMLDDVTQDGDSVRTTVV